LASTRSCQFEPASVQKPGSHGWNCFGDRYEKAGFFQEKTDEKGELVSDEAHKVLAQLVLSTHHTRLTTPLHKLTEEDFAPSIYFPADERGEEGQVVEMADEPKLSHQHQVMEMVKKLRKAYGRMSLQGILLQFLEEANAFPRSDDLRDLRELRDRWAEYMFVVNYDLQTAAGLIVAQTRKILLPAVSAEKRLEYDNGKVLHNVVSLVKNIPRVTTEVLPRQYFFV